MRLYSIPEEAEEDFLELAAATDFRERKNIREALRELKGLKLDSERIVTYSFAPDTVKRLSSLRERLSNKRDSKPSRIDQSAAKNEDNDCAKIDSKKDGYLNTQVGKEVSGWNANINSAHNGTLIPKPSILENEHYNDDKYLSGPSKELRGISVLKDNTDGSDSAANIVKLKKPPRHVIRTHSSPFSPSFLLSPIRKTIAKLRSGHDTISKSESEKVMPVDCKVTNSAARESANEMKVESDKIMKTQESKRILSESSVPVTRDDSSWTEEVKKERSKSYNNENDYDIDGVKIRKKPTLSRKNRVEAEWNMSPRLGSKFRKKLVSAGDSVPITSGSNDTLVRSGVDKSANVETLKLEEREKLGIKSETKVSRAESAKKPPARRKLPDIPVQISKSDDDGSDENIHEQTLQLLQERRQKRRDKMKKKKESEKLKKESVDDSKVSDSETKTDILSGNKGTAEERPRSRKKEIRLRREMQLLNRASETIINKAESQLSKSDHSDSDGKEIEKPVGQFSHLPRRTKSDMVRSKPPITPESAARRVEESKEEPVVIVDLEKFDALPTENKIDLIGNLMQEEAKLQETLRRTTSFSERRKIRAEVRQLREKRTALEGPPEAQPVTVLQRSISLSAGEVTPKLSTPCQEKKQSIEELRKQLSETSDYDEKRKIRLALRQLRQQSRESETNNQGSGVQRSQSCLEIQLSNNNSGIIKEVTESLKNATVLNDVSPDVTERKSLKDGKVNDRVVDSRTVARSQSVVETNRKSNSIEKRLTNGISPNEKKHTVEKTKVHDTSTQESKTSQPDITNKKEIINGVSPSVKKDIRDENKLDRTNFRGHRTSVEISDHDSKPHNRSKATDNSTHGIKSNGHVVNDGQSSVQQNSSLSQTGKEGETSDKKHSIHSHSKAQHSISRHSVHSKSHSKTETHLEAKTKPDTVQSKSDKSLRFSVGDREQSKNNSSEKFYVKQRKHSLESLADSYRLRDKEDKNNRHFNSTLLKDVIGKLEDKISKSIEDNKFSKPRVSKTLEDKSSKPPSKILISRANSESSLLRRFKDSDNKSTKDNTIKQLKDTENLSKIQNKASRSKEVLNNDIESTSLNSVEIKQREIKDSNLDAKLNEKYSERLSPIIPWLEEKKKSSPTPNELDKLMSTMDIENAFSEILDAVEHCPEGMDTSEASTPDAPIVPIVEEEQGSESGASGLESTNEKMIENMNIHEIENKSDEMDKHAESGDNGDNKVNVRELSDSKDSENVEMMASTEDSSNSAITNSAINSKSGITKKSEAQIKLKSSLSLDLSPVQKENSAISVLHGEDGTVTVQEVNKVQEGDTTITEWRKVRRTQSKTEERETDTIKEKMVTSPGGSTSVYEKDVSKTKHKITSRGSNYFTRNNYNLKRLKDFEGTESVQHELSSVSENMSVSKNESWGSKSEAKLTLNKDGEMEQNLKAITTDVVPEADKNRKDVIMTTTSEDADSEDSVLERIEKRPSGCPVISCPMMEVMVFEGSPAIFECSVTASPLPTVVWVKGDNPVQDSDIISSQFDPETGKSFLKFSEVTTGDIGDYSCVFTNPLGTAQTTAKLNVKTKGHGQPSFITKLADVSVIEGCSIVLECEVSSVDTVSWYKDGCIQRDSADFRQIFDGVKAKLEIGEVFLDDEGTYACVIKNSNGECKCSCKVTVKESESDHIVPPAFLKKLESQIVDEDDMVIMECDIIGSPQPIITWYCDRRALPEGDKFSTSFDGRVARLVIKKASKGDNGRYECSAESSAGRITCECLLVVKEIKNPPSVSKPLSDITVYDRKAAILECCIVGNPSPQIAWHKNGLIIGPVFDFKQSYIDNVARLEIGKVCVQDSGTYQCIGTSDLGEISTSCNLTVEEKPAPKSDSYTQNDEVIPSQENTPSSKTTAKVVKNFPAGFTAISDDHRVKAAKTQASKVMLVRQSSLKLLDRNQKSPNVAVKRSESFQTGKKDKKEDSVVQDKIAGSISKDKTNISSQKSEMTRRKNTTLEAEIKSDDVSKLKTEISVQVKRDSDVEEPKVETKTVNSETDYSELELKSNSVKKSDNMSNLTKTTVETWKNNSAVAKPKEIETKISVSSIQINNIPKKNENVSVDSDKENEGKNSAEAQNVGLSSVMPDISKTVELDHNENIKVSDKTMAIPQIQVENVSNELQANPNKISGISNDFQAPPSLVVAVSAKEPEKSSVSALKTAKDSAISKFEKLCSEAEEIQAKPKWKVSSDLRRTQSVKTAGSEKPEWLQMKLKKVGEPKAPAVERKVKSPLEIDTTPQTKTETEKSLSSVPKDIKLTRSHSARVADRKIVPPLSDSTNTHTFDRNNDKLGITPVSERAKMFQINQESSSPVLKRKDSPLAIISKAINLSRAESVRAPVGHRSINVRDVQRSHSFKTSEPTASEKGVTLDLTPPNNEGKETSRESGVAKKPIKYWDPTAAPATTMDYNTITDEEELNKMLANSDNFEERKKIRARIKEVRDLRNKKWEEDRKAREAAQQDLLKQRQKEADLEKQRKLEAFKVQAAQPHESKHLEIQEKRLKEKMQQAELLKQKELERYDRMARHEDLSQKSTVTQETTRDGKTVTTRRVETVSKTGGVGGMSYGKPAGNEDNHKTTDEFEIGQDPTTDCGVARTTIRTRMSSKLEDAETLVTKLINASSPAVSGTLNVKTESWSSKDGITHKSEKIESWGAKKPQGAMNAFKQMDAQNNPQTNLGPPKGLARSPSAIKTMLLEWTKAMTREYADKIVIENFSTSWNDGLAFCALIHHFYPESFDFNSLDARNRRSNFELAFDTAEKYADIAPLLDVEDMVKMKKPDWKCVFTYVQSFYRKLKDHENNRTK